MGGGSRNKILITLACAASHRIHGFDYCWFETFARKPIKGPSRIFFYNVVQNADNLFIDRIDLVHDAHRVKNVGLVCFVYLSAMRLAGNLDCAFQGAVIITPRHSESRLASVGLAQISGDHNLLTIMTNREAACSRHSLRSLGM
jgi:hypothetical protein